MEAKRKRLVRRRKTCGYSGRGAIYSWLRVHHEEILRLRVGEERPWADLLIDLETDLRAEGTPGATSITNVCNIWKRVCRDVEAEPQRKKRLMPSRLSKDWRPAMLDQLGAARGAPAPPGSGVGSLPAPLPAFDSGRSYGSAQIPDDQVDLSLAPETYEDDDGKIKPMPLEARLRFARAKMRLKVSDARTFRILNG